MSGDHAKLAAASQSGWQNRGGKMSYNRGSIECDGCSTPNDSHFEPGAHTALAVGLKPANQKELNFFWLCGDCGPDYNYDPREFYTAEFFDTEPYCDRCEYEPVENWGHVCPDCEDGVI